MYLSDSMNFYFAIASIKQFFNHWSFSNHLISVYLQYVRELPDPVLTDALMPQFEKVSSSSNPQKRIEGMKNLIGLLPESNRALLTWIFVHMSHVIERERFNKMTLQNVSIVLSPTMRISHRVLTCFFENSHILFGDSGPSFIYSWFLEKPSFPFTLASKNLGFILFWTKICIFLTFIAFMLFHFLVQKLQSIETLILDLFCP